ncbi:MAG TPA: toprim domain-containing protein, partial [bacterium]|nr:toprim domain-containing protein [bacterium]
LIRLDHNSRPVSFFYNRIMIPIIYNKNVIGFGGRLLSGDGPKYINSPDTVVFNKKEHLFGIDFVREGLKDFPFVVLCEGYFDVIAMHSSGFRTAVAALGTAVSDSHLRTLAKFRKPVVVFLDGDEAGRKAARRITTLQIPDDIDLRVAFIKDEGDDPDSLLRKEGGAEKVRALIEKARPLFQEMIDEQLEKYNGTENLEEKLKIEGDIRSILKNIPHRKVRTYAVYIQKRSGNMINTGTLRHNNIEKAAQKAELGVHVKTEDADTELDSKLRDLAVMACMYNEFIPSLESLSDAFYDSRFALVFDDIMKRYNEQEDLGDIIEKLDDTGAVSEKYRDKSFDLIDRDFRRNHAYLMIEKNDRLRRVLALENNDEARKRIAALLQDTAALRKIYNDNAI